MASGDVCCCETCWAVILKIHTTEITSPNARSLSIVLFIRSEPRKAKIEKTRAVVTLQSLRRGETVSKHPLVHDLGFLRAPGLQGGGTMKTPMEFLRSGQEKGAIGYILLWAMGIPLSILPIVFLLRGC